MIATYTKLKDATWGVRVVGATPSAGSTVTVSKKDGGKKDERIERVLWTGKDPNGSTVTLCAIAQSGKGSSGGSSGGNRAPGGRRCSYCGSPSCAKAWNPRDLCDED